jgi:phosphopantothenoylcysteine decarboxylase/phosphopantothenate--cysteine ligase
MRFLVTAGPTEEYLDDVRFISNPSSGRMGYAVAREARRRGHKVTLVSGPVALDPPSGVKVVKVVSAAQMNRAVRRAFARCDVVVMTAAVADYAPRRRVRGKIKKASRELSIRLVRTPDILEGLGARKGRRLLVGFALESSDELANARAKLAAKRLDWIVCNRPDSFRSDRIRATILTRNGGAYNFPTLGKDRLARLLVRLVERAADRSSG